VIHLDEIAGYAGNAKEVDIRCALHRVEAALYGEWQNWSADVLSIFASIIGFGLLA
jgi:hypothetical protein